MKTVPPKPANVLEASQYTSPWVVHEPERALTRDDLERAKDSLLAPRKREPMIFNADGHGYTVDDWTANATASNAVAEFLRWGVR